MIVFFYFLIMTKNSSLWVRKTRFRINFFSEEALSEEQLVRKFGKNGERSYQNKTNQKNNTAVSSDTKASPGRTDAKVQIFLQTQTSCRLETSMDDYVAAVAVAMAAYRRRK